MASNKETPRQKMISMMYLVLTALLALNVSDQVLKGFITVDESIDKSKKIITDNNKQIELAFQDYIKQGNLEAKPYYDKCLLARKKIETVMNYIDTMKYNLISEAEDTQQPDTVQMRFMKHLEDFDTPTGMFIGSDETNPKKNRYSALDLKQNLNQLSNDLIDMVTELEKGKKLDGTDGKSLKEKIKTIIPIDRNSLEDGIKMNWEMDNFYNIPTAAVITNFDKMQTDLKNLESEMFRVLAASSNKYLFKINKLQAKVLAPNAYILSGEKFKADILLSASSNALSADRMKVLIGAKYDSVQKKLINPGQEITIEDGIGKYEVNGIGQGPQNINGLVEYKDPSGQLQYYPFSYTYMVAAPFNAVSADNMNVMYIGVDNPVSASAAGFAPTDLTVKISGCGTSLKSVGPGKFVANATSTGTCFVTIYAKTSEGLKQQGPAKPFRVKSIPPPIVKINGKPVLSTLDLKATEIAAINSIGAVCLGFEFPVNAKIVEASISGIDRFGNITAEKINSSVLGKDAKKILSDLGPGKRAFIEGIKVSVNGQIFTAPDVIIKRKL